MQYRTLGQTGEKVSALGFGCMRLPTTDGQGGANVDRDEAVKMIRHGIDRGVNYLDTAKVYHGGVGEAVVGQALQGGYRERVMVATKLPTWDDSVLANPDRCLDSQLKTLGVEQIDVFFLHCLQAHSWEACQRRRLTDWLAKKKEQGKIRYAAFSFHDSYSVFEQIVDSFAWDVAQIQYNYVGTQVQAGERGLKYAASRGMAVIVMEPLFGGVLANPPGAMGERFAAAGKNPVDLALRWLWNQPEVSLVLSGMSMLPQVVQNLDIADRSGVFTLTTDDIAFIGDVQQLYRELVPVACSRCRYCDGCPAGVDIASNFNAYNDASVLTGNAALCRNLYAMMAPERRASNCTECGVCETKCPQQLPIRNLLKKVHEFLS